MSSEIAIKVESLGKCYQIYEQPHDRLKQMLLPRLYRLAGKTGKSYFREFWALRDVSFSVNKGKVAGIIGKNGAGKSTLLQILCGTVMATSGKIHVKGRIAALLELGAGFNPDFTGIENVRMNGQILGFSHKEIDRKLPDIAAFADIGDFIRQPVKTYSSGMFARLAFAVAVHVDPDILVVDEALSVGDSWFQHKSMAKMRSLMQRGCTVLFVSHSIDAVRALCDEVIWIENGSIKMQGDVTEISNLYMNEVFIEHNRITIQNLQQSRDTDLETSLSEIDDIEPNEQSKSPEENSDNKNLAEDSNHPTTELVNSKILHIQNKCLRNSKGEVADHLEQGEFFSLEFTLQFYKDIKNISLGILIKDQFAQELTGESYFNTHRHGLNFKNGQSTTFVFKSKMLLRGGQSYSVALRVNQVAQWDRSDNIIVYSDETALVFDVLANSEDPMWFKFKMPFEVNCQ